MRLFAIWRCNIECRSSLHAAGILFVRRVISYAASGLLIFSFSILFLQTRGTILKSADVFHKYCTFFSRADKSDILLNKGSNGET